MENFYRRIEETMATLSPSCRSILNRWDYRSKFSPHIVPIPKPALHQARLLVRTLHRIAHTAVYADFVRSALNEDARWVLDVPSSNSSTLMAYDFHWAPQEEQLRLIEINTNASSYLLSDVLYRAHGLPPTAAHQNPRDNIVSTFEAEWSHWLGAKTPRQIAIVDAAPQRQPMYAEFLLYQDLFRTQGWACEIEDVADLRWDGDRLLSQQSEKVYNAVYNRSTDFYFREGSYQALRSAFESSSVAVTPHPREYALLADKSRLRDLWRPEVLARFDLTSEERAALRTALLKSFYLSDFAGPDDLWSQRKNLFFKPRSLYGGKSVYRGQSLSKKVFERLLNEDPLIQEFAPADTFAGDWRYDLRFFAYQDQIQLAVARLYQGQVTNFSTPGGGLAALQPI